MSIARQTDGAVTTWKVKRALSPIDKPVTPLSERPITPRNFENFEQVTVKYPQTMPELSGRKRSCSRYFRKLLLSRGMSGTLNAWWRLAVVSGALPTTLFKLLWRVWSF